MAWKQLTNVYWDLYFSLLGDVVTSLLITIYIYIAYYSILYYIFLMVYRTFPIKKSIFFNFDACSATSILHIMKNFISVLFTYKHAFTFISIRTLPTLLYLLNAIIGSDCQQND